MQFPLEEIKVVAQSHWREIISTLGQVPMASLDGRHHPCPKCGGKDRFRLLNADTGSVICNQCFSKKNGDGLAAVMWARGIEFPEAIRLIAEMLGIPIDGHVPDTGKMIIDPIEEIATAKGTTAEAFKAYGCLPAKNKGIKFPVYDPDGNRCSGFVIENGQDKGKFFKGKSAGLFWPMTRPEPGEKWFMVEGVKDAAALWNLGHKNTVGLNTSKLAAKYCHLFAGVHLTIIPDRDQAGEDGAKQTAKNLASHTASVRLARLPGELKESDGDDVRDVLKRSGGQDMVERAIRMAVLLDNQGNPVNDIEFPLLSGPELAATDTKLEALVDRVLYRHQPAVIGGPSKALKTSCLIDLGVSLAVARKFLGEFWVPQSWRVALMSGESGLAALKNCYQRVCEFKGVNPNIDPTGFFVSESLPRLDSPAHLESVKRLISTHNLDVLLIDPMYLAAGSANAASLNEMGALLRATNDACSESGCTLIIAHHTIKRPGLAIKRDQFEPLEREDLHGSGIGEWCRQWILLNRRLPYQPNSPHEMNLTFGGSAGHSGNYALAVDEGQFDPAQFGGLEKWEATVSPLAETLELDRIDKDRQEQEQKLSQAIEAVTEAVHGADDLFSPNTIRTAAKGAGRHFQDAWGHLLSEGIITQHPTAHRSGHPLFLLTLTNPQ